MNVDRIEFDANVRRSDAAGRTFPIDYSGLKVHQTLWEMLAGQSGYRPILLIFAALFFVLVMLLPVPGSRVDLVEQVDPLGYDLESNTETIADSVNSHKNTEAVQAWQLSGLPPHSAEGLDSSERIARQALIMVGILIVAALFWRTEALPIAGTVSLVAVLMYAFKILPGNEIPGAFMQDVVFFILGILAVAVGVSKTGLDKRIGLLLLSRINSAGALAFIFFPTFAICSAFLSAHALVALLLPVMMGIYKATCTAHGIKRDRLLAIFSSWASPLRRTLAGPGPPRRAHGTP